MSDTEDDAPGELTRFGANTRFYATAEEDVRRQLELLKSPNSVIPSTTSNSDFSPTLEERKEEKEKIERKQHPKNCK